MAGLIGGSDVDTGIEGWHASHVVGAPGMALGGMETGGTAFEVASTCCRLNDVLPMEMFEDGNTEV